MIERIISSIEGDLCMASCFYCRKRVWYRRDLSNTFATNSERTYAYECTNCKIIFLIKNESSRKSRGTREYWQGKSLQGKSLQGKSLQGKSVVKGKAVKVLVRDSL
ncbi:MAG: hypothetical protein RMJ59_04045 [Candidatus Nitrosocaldus sp.]|nr:hypothetical protein [Candidatus Nitrosocaldus sp.]